MFMKTLFRALMAVITVCALTSETAFAQATAQMSGRVTDETGAVLPGVTVTATQTQTGLLRSTVTNEAGAYSLPSLPIGPYRLEAMLPGFRTFVQEGITLLVNANLVVDPVLSLGEIAEMITVTARPSDIAVETRSLGVGTVIEQERILELPLPARNVTQLVLAAGAAVQVGESPSWGMATGINIAAAGGQRFGVNYLLDGAEHTNRFDQTGMPMPFPDALQEFRVSTSTQEAGTGRSSGASVNSVTMSGSNAFRGNLFWFGRNAAFNATAADALRKDPLKRNQTGGTFGGPILTNRMFFFAGYQSTIERRYPSDTLSIVPTQAMLNGDWTAFNQCHSPNWNATGQSLGFAAGSVSPALYSPAALAVAARLPAAQNACGEVRWGIRNERHDKQPIIRVDYQHAANHSTFGRYVGTYHDQPVAFDSGNALTAAAGAAGFNDKHHGTVLGHTWVINPAMVNATRFSYNRITVNKQGARFFNPEDVGINMWTSVDTHFILTVPGAFSLGSGPTALRQMWQNQWQISNDFNWTRGAHQFGFGGTFGRADVLSLAHTRGVGGLAFTASNTGLALGDFMLGRLDNNRQSMPSTLSPHQYYTGLYAQDTWRAGPNWTLNLGVRWEPFIPMVWDENEYGGIRVYNFSADRFKAGQKSVVFPNAPAGFTYPSQPGFSSATDFDGHSGISRSLGKFAPRLGVAWDPTGQGLTAVRAGYGLAYDVIELQSLLNSNNVSPWAADIIHRNATLDNPWQGLAGGNPFPFDWRQTPLFIPGSVFIPFGEDLDMTYVQSWNVGIQQQIGGRWLASASYLGTASSRLWNTTAVNPSLILTQASHPGLFTGPNTCVLEGVTYTPCNQLGNINQRRELRLWAAQNNPALLPDAMLFSNIDEYRSDSTARYNGLLTSVRGSIHGVNLNANYTLSKCMSDRINVGVSNPNQTFHNEATKDRARCMGDRRHIFNFTGVATSPQFDDPTWRAIASNWRLSASYRTMSGAPLTVTAGADWARTGLGGQTADQLSDNVYQDTSGTLGSQFLNRAAFAAPAIGTYGSSNFFSINGLRTWDLDMTLSRLFNVSSHRIELRADAINVLNAVRPTNPSTVLTSPNFGRIINVQEPRIMQVAIKYIF